MNFWFCLLFAQMGRQISFGLHWWRPESPQPSLFEHVTGESSSLAYWNFWKKKYIFTQDGVLAHIANVTQTWCLAHFRAFWDKQKWPPSSPNFKSMDCLLSGLFGRGTFQLVPTTIWIHWRLPFIQVWPSFAEKL